MTRRTQLALGLDLVAILLFAAVGRFNHQESLIGTPLTAWPFVIGAAVGWLLVRFRSGRDPVPVGPGITVWVSTLVLGLLLRALTGGGVAVSFVVVATLVLGILLLGWRLVVERWEADRAGGVAPEHAEEEQTRDVDA